MRNCTNSQGYQSVYSNNYISQSCSNIKPDSDLNYQIEMQNIEIQDIDEPDSEPLQDPDYQKILQNQDFFPKIFLQPSEIRLHKNSGLMVINRDNNSPDKYTEEQVLPIAFDQSAIRAFQSEGKQTFQNPAGHGLLSLFKRTKTRRPKLAICVCVYSQPKHMLKSTIKGIQQSYEHFFKKAGISPHQIILVVIFDGIQKVNAEKDQTANMISFFNEIDIMNGFTHKPYGKSLDQYLKDLQKNKFQLDQFLNDDVSLFTQDQLNQLKPKLFQNQYNEYVRIKKLQKQIEMLKKEKKIRLDSMPHDVYKKYEELSYNFCQENNMFYETQEEIQQYLSTKKNVRLKLIYEALHDTETLCKNYLESRQGTSILYPVRLESNSLKNPRSMNGQQDFSKKGDSSKQKQYNYVFFCVKHKNQGKLSSHLLFFQGFCKLFDPEYCILTDVGVKPSKDSIYKMWAHMQKTPKCGGVCGYMGLKLQNPADDMGYRDDGYDDNEVDCCTRAFDCFFSVQRAQQFQYHFAHMIDKPFQAAFGYIHVLPGAFSGYRWKTLKSIKYKQPQKQSVEGVSAVQTQRNTLNKRVEEEDYDQQALMSKYLKTAHNQNLKITLQEANMYLAEDRVLCLGIHALGYDLHYLPDAQSTVDPVTSLTRLLGQRRRWINGSWFAFNYVRENWNEGQNILFYLQILYYSLNQKITWISLALFYVTMNLTLIATVNQYVIPLAERFFSAKRDYELANYRIWIFNVKSIIESIPDIINFVFILMMFALILHSTLLNHNNPGFKRIYYFISSVLGIYGLAVLAILGINVYQILFETIQGTIVEDFIIPIIYLRIMIFFIVGGHALPILWTFSLRKYVQMIVSLLSYIFYAPTYLNILLTFAFCRIDDLSWGTKGLDSDGGGVQRDWQRRKYIFVLQYISINCVIAYALVKLSDYDFPRNIIILSSAILVVFLLAFRLFFATIYLVKYYIKRAFFMRFSPEYINQNRAQGERVFKALRLIEQRIKEIQKKETKKKKQQEFHRLKSITSQLLSKSTLSQFGNKLRSKVAQHLVSNNIFSKKQLLDPKRRLRPRKKINIRKKLNTVEQMSHQDSQESRNNINLSQNLKETDLASKNLVEMNSYEKTNAFKKGKQSSKSGNSKGPQEKQNNQKQHYEIVVPEVDKKENIRARIQAMRTKREKRQPSKSKQKSEKQ